MFKTGIRIFVSTKLEQNNIWCWIFTRTTYAAINYKEHKCAHVHDVLCIYSKLCTCTCPTNHRVAMTTASRRCSVEKGRMSGSRHRYQRKYCGEDWWRSKCKCYKNIIYMYYRNLYWFHLQNFCTSVTYSTNAHNYTHCTHYYRRIPQLHACSPRE